MCDSFSWKICRERFGIYIIHMLAGSSCHCWLEGKYKPPRQALLSPLTSPRRRGLWRQHLSSSHTVALHPVGLPEGTQSVHR